jgi:hypothetical protein
LGLCVTQLSIADRIFSLKLLGTPSVGQTAA